MGLLKDRHGTYYARKRVPPELQEAMARVLGADKARQVWLKRSLSTKSIAEANIRAKPVLMEFDRLVASARDLVAARPLRRSLSRAEIRRMAEYHYAQKLAGDDYYRREAPSIEAENRALAEELDGPEDWSADPIPQFGLSGGQMFEAREELPAILREAEDALAKGDLSYCAHMIEDVLETFQINLDKACPDYRELGLEVLRAQVRSTRDVAARYRGEPIPTPPLPLVGSSAPLGGDTLKDALDGWRKEKSPTQGVLREYERAVRLFTQLHGEMPVAAITRTHARTFREALQQVPRHRGEALRHASLLELVDWSDKHPEAARISNNTAGKLLGGVQTIALWAFRNGMVPDEVRWADPFAAMRIEKDAPEREAFTVPELNTLFASPVFTQGERPKPGKREAAFWLPLLGLFTGARRGELATLRPADVQDIEGVLSFVIEEDKTAGKKLKTRASARTIPVHPHLTKLGWPSFVLSVREKQGEGAWLFPEVAPSAPGGLKAWTKWFHRHLRSVGVTDNHKVFHSFRHIFKDGLRAARTPEDLSDALTGHSNASVGRGYGAKHIVLRYGIDTLRDAIERVSYRGLDLTQVRSDGH